MEGLCLTNRIADAFKLLQLIKSSPVKPKTVILNTLIHALCKNGKVGRARSLMNEMQDPNDVTFNVLISAYCKEENLVLALVFLEKSFTMGFVSNVVKLGLRLLKEMEHKGCLLNADIYNILISGFCESRVLDSALDMFNEMKTDGISWNFVTYDTLIKGLCSAERMEDGFKILVLMEEENHLEEAFEFLFKMQNLFPSAVDRSLRILEFCDEGKVEDAKRVYDQMSGEGGNPGVLVYDCLICGFCLKSCVRQAVGLMNELVGCGYFPVASTFNAIISGFCTHGKRGSALTDVGYSEGCNAFATNVAKEYYTGWVNMEFSSSLS
ncbi:hypothetical protein REPUB_Repub09cG0207400 [Reevesia pubescens]